MASQTGFHSPRVIPPVPGTGQEGQPIWRQQLRHGMSDGSLSDMVCPICDCKGYIKKEEEEGNSTINPLRMAFAVEGDIIKAQHDSRSNREVHRSLSTCDCDLRRL